MNYIKIPFCKKNISSYYGINVDLNDLIPEIMIKIFHMKTYAYSFSRSMRKVEKLLALNFYKIINLDMLPPFSHYVKSIMNDYYPIVQIQTTLIRSDIFPNYVYSDKFYFSNLKAYNEHFKINSHFSKKFDVLNNIKYLAINKQCRKEKFKLLTYFTQPIYLDEELTLIKFLQEFCEKNSIIFQIKLHPRSSISQYKNLNIQLINPCIPSQEVIAKSDIIVTRTSSIGLDCWYANVPVIFFVNGTLKGDGIEYIPENYAGKIFQNITVEKFSDIFKEITVNFYEHSFHDDLIIDKKDIVNKLLSK
jgi:hypothetical protein